MGRFLHLKLPFLSRRGPRMVLALSWFLGLLMGAVVSAAASESLVPLMRAAAAGCVSIDRLLTAILLPFLLSALAVYLQEPWLLLLIAFGKAFLVSFLGFGLMAAYGSAGWLLRWLLMFGDCCSLPLLFWYWLRHISGLRKFTIAGTAPVLLVAVAIGSFDYCIVSPFLTAVIS